jgi:hypothetical protein
MGAVVIRKLFRWALSDLPCAPLTRNGHNLTPPSGEAQAVSRQFFAGGAAAPKTVSPIYPQSPQHAVGLERELGVEFKSRTRLGRRVVVFDIGERGWRRT